ncbi:hypothetical protein C8Q78DRAFT_377583 [Trametes maxima]|nr:hypothetical protein C8Q78DRAFT_377583 [Trametes maxima]
MSPLGAGREVPWIALRWGVAISVLSGRVAGGAAHPARSVRPLPSSRRTASRVRPVRRRLSARWCKSFRAYSLRWGSPCAYLPGCFHTRSWLGHNISAQRSAPGVICASPRMCVLISDVRRTYFLTTHGRGTIVSWPRETSPFMEDADSSRLWVFRGVHVWGPGDHSALAHQTRRQGVLGIIGTPFTPPHACLRLRSHLHAWAVPRLTRRPQFATTTRPTRLVAAYRYADMKAGLRSVPEGGRGR